MSKVSVVYWSQSGNTQAMAEAVAAGITEAGKEAEVVYVSDVNVADLTAEKAFALGCPAMGAEVLEEGEFEPFMESIDGSISGKTIALFGSYGWGDEIRYCWQAAAIRAEEAMATASAPIAIAFAKSAGTRSPPVITKSISR